MTAVQERTATSSVLARGGAVLATAGLLAAGLVFGAAPASAAEGDATVDNVSLSWQMNDETGGGAYFGGCNFLSAGKAGDSGSSRVWTEADGFYKASEGNVTITKPNSVGEQVAPTWADKCKTGAGANVSPSPGSTTANQVNLAGGTGIVNPTTDTGRITFDGDFTIVFYGGLTYWTVSDPVLDVVDGVGTLKGTGTGFGASMEDTTKWEALPAQQIDLATFEGVDLTATGATIAPDYAGVEVTTTGTPQNRTAATWGSFPQSFVDYNGLTGQSSYWYSSGGAADAKKPAKPFSVAYTAAEAPVEEPAVAGDVDVSIPEAEVTPPVDPETGEFSWAWASTAGANLGTATQEGDTFVAAGALTTVAVTDTRAGGTTPYTWSVSGQSSDFTSPTGESFPASNLGWTPNIAEGASPSVVKGAAVAPSKAADAGLSVAQKLASSTAAASATVGADLKLEVPTTVKQGDYRATLTITAIS